jgi:hypothetical protein
MNQCRVSRKGPFGCERLSCVPDSLTVILSRHLDILTPIAAGQRQKTPSRCTRSGVGLEKQRAHISAESVGAGAGIASAVRRTHGRVAPKRIAATGNKKLLIRS